MQAINTFKHIIYTNLNLPSLIYLSFINVARDKHSIQACRRAERLP